LKNIRGPLVTGENEKGFTLMELIVVCVLIGIMLTLTIPTMRDAVFTDPLRVTSRRVIGLVGGVRELSARTQKPHLLYISQLENRIWFKEDTSREEEENEEADLKKDLLFPEGVSLTEVWIGGGGSVFEEQLAVWISPQGYMNRMMIQLQDDDGESLTIQFHTFLETASILEEFSPPAN
jgi:prepilin-type N-terminal cleavage/methylation domain-containing protein